MVCALLCPRQQQLRHFNTFRMQKNIQKSGISDASGFVVLLSSLFTQKIVWPYAQRAFLIGIGDD